MRKIHKIDTAKTSLPTKKRVSAYARVSLESERLLNSLSAQVSHYSAFIQKHTEWEYVGVYVDSGQSGTSSGRDEFQRLIADCEAGKIDIVLTKSISRFARNTVDLLETVRHLRELGVEVHFEREKINSMSNDGELMLSILASFAQEESRTVSENLKWAIRKGFQEGKPHRQHIYGYRYRNGNFEIVPEEAEVVRFIFDCYLKEISAANTAKMLNESGTKPYYGEKFRGCTIRNMLVNEFYMGTLLLQKTYVECHLTHKGRKNNGELPMYCIEDSHPAIISRAVFQRAQEERARRKALGVLANVGINTSELTSKLICGACGGVFHRKTRTSSNGTRTVYWRCLTKANKGKAVCSMGNVIDDKLKQVATDVLGLGEYDSDAFVKHINFVSVTGKETLVFHFMDGTEVTKHWKRTGHKDAWTVERKQAESDRRARLREGKQ